MKLTPYKNKSPMIKALLKSLAGFDAEAGLCSMCGKVTGDTQDFRDSLSRTEYEISGMCQSCQDEVFG